MHPHFLHRKICTCYHNYINRILLLCSKVWWKYHMQLRNSVDKILLNYPIRWHYIISSIYFIAPYIICLYMHLFPSHLKIKREILFIYLITYGAVSDSLPVMFKQRRLTRLFSLLRLFSLRKLQKYIFKFSIVWSTKFIFRPCVALDL